MDEVIAALLDQLKALTVGGRQVPVFDVIAPPEAMMPFCVLWYSGGKPDATALDGSEGLADRIGVTHTAPSGAGCLTMQAQTRARLHRAHIMTDTQSVELGLCDSQRIQPDLTVNPGGLSHPMYGVDLYELHATSR